MAPTIRMNLTQKRYAEERIKEMSQAKIRVAEQTLTVPDKRLRAGERIELIRKGKVKLLSPRALAARPSHCRDYLSDVFDFSKFEDQNPKQVKLDRRRAAILKRSKQIRDEILLGDREAALENIAAFEKF